VREGPATGDPAKDLRQRSLFRFELDDDFLLGSDDSFTAGWSFQLHSPLDPTWRHGFGSWVGRFPSLGDDGAGGRVVRWAMGLGQQILTPHDISTERPQPDDVPWAGMLTVSSAWSAYDDRRLGALQLVGGCMGPCSGAEAVQKFIHDDLGLGPAPRGWDNQLVNRALVNANYEYRHKLTADRPFEPARFTHDLSAGGLAGLGNLATYAGAQLEYRFGWGVPPGFTGIPEAPGLGVMLDPVYVDAAAPAGSVSARHTYFTLVGRAVASAYFAPAEGGKTVNGGEHPELPGYPGRYQALAGFHLERLPFAFHITYDHSFEPAGLPSSSDWINLTFEYRFQFAAGGISKARDASSRPAWL